MNPKTMKVAVVLSVTVDLDDYRLNYGDEDAATIRETIRQAFADGGRAVLANGIAEVEVKS